MLCNGNFVKPNSTFMNELGNEPFLPEKQFSESNGRFDNTYHVSSGKENDLHECDRTCSQKKIAAKRRKEMPGINEVAGIAPSHKLLSNNHYTTKADLDAESIKYTSLTSDLFRLHIKRGEYAYVRPNDIILMESCDHLVKVYLAYGGNIKKTVRNSTLKEFLSQLPNTQFVRIGRFCAVNIARLSGGNYHEQIFEFDFHLSIKLKHSISIAVFNNIGK